MKKIIEILDKTWKIFFFSTSILYVATMGLFEKSISNFLAEVYMGCIYATFMYVILTTTLQSILAHGKNKVKEILCILSAIFISGMFVKLLLMSLNKINFSFFILSLFLLIAIDLFILISKNKKVENKKELPE